MKILFVEDHRTFGEQMSDALRQLPNVSDVILCRSRDAALAALRDGFFDLIVLDLTLPAADDGLEVAAVHGQSVFYEAVKICPGIPIFILTGSDADEFTKGLLRHGERIDLWGSKEETNTLDYFEKEAADRLATEVSRVAAQVHAVEQVELNFRGLALGLSTGALRCIRVAARRMGAVTAEVVSLTGGLSSAKVLRVTMRNDAHQVIHATVAKLGSLAEIKSELEAFNHYVKRLPVGSFPPLTDSVEKGACGSAAAFYTLAHDYGSSLFDVVIADDAAAADVVAATRARLGIWQGAARYAECAVRDIRRRMLSDLTFNEIVGRYGLEVEDVEAKILRAGSCCIHGDLHGSNILVDAGNNPIVIDFGDVGIGPACLDPVTLELCFAFHPEAVRLGLSTRLADRLINWPDRATYEANHPFPLLTHACREWAYDAAGSDLAVLASGYAYVVRQLRYETVDSQVTLRLLDSVIEKIRAS